MFHFRRQSDCSIASRGQNTDFHWFLCQHTRRQLQILQETAAYKQAVRETDSDVQPLPYCFANKERFLHIVDVAIRYLSVPTVIPSMLSAV